MSDRAVVIIVSLLLLIVMCALLVAALSWVPSQIRRLDERLARLETIETRLALLQEKLASFDKIEQKLGDTAAVAAPLTRIDGSVAEITTKLNQVVVPGVNDLKDRMPSKSDLDRVSGQVSQMEQKLLAAPAKADPDVAKLAKDVSDLRELVGAMRQQMDTATRDIARDVKQLHLEIMKVTQK